MKTIEDTLAYLGDRIVIQAGKLGHTNLSRIEREIQRAVFDTLISVEQFILEGSDGIARD